MNVQTAEAQNRKFVCFIYPIAFEVEWQMLKDYVRSAAPAPSITRVEVPRSIPTMGRHGWVAVKGPVDANNLWNLFTNETFLGQALTVHLFDTTQHPPQLVAAKTQAKSHWCRHCLQFQVNSCTSEFLPGSPAGTYAMEFQQHVPSAGRPVPQSSINTMNGARITESRGVFISNLNSKTTDSEIHVLMREKVGSPTNVKWRQNQKKTHATVEFSSAREAQQAISKFDGYMYKGWKMSVRHDKNQGFEQTRTAQSERREGAQVSNTPTNRYPMVVDGSN